jgi:hypothetical protein
MQFVAPRPFGDPDAAARKLLEQANAFEPVQDGRVYIEKINGPFINQLKGTPAEYKAGLDLAIAKGWLVLHEVRDLREVHRGRRGDVCVIRAFGAHSIAEPFCLRLGPIVVSLRPIWPRAPAGASFRAAIRILGHHYVLLAALVNARRVFYEIHFDMDDTAGCSGCRYKEIS